MIKKAQLFLTVSVVILLLIACKSKASIIIEEATPSSTPIPIPTLQLVEAPIVTEVPKQLSFAFDPYYLPAYGKEFIGDNLDDYNAIMTALINAKEQVTLTTIHTEDEFSHLIRAITTFYIPQNLLYDYRYMIGTGPYSFDEDAKIVTIKYAFPQTQYIEKYQEFTNLIESIFHENVTDLSNEFETSKELYLYIVNHSAYELDMTKNTYDAFTTHKAYCQTYSGMYQYLLWQADIENYLVFGNTGIDHEWNLVSLDGELYHMDTTWDTGDLMYFGMDDARCTETNHGTTFMRPGDSLLDHYNGEPFLCTSDKYNNYWLEFAK